MLLNGRLPSLQSLMLLFNLLVLYNLSIVSVTTESEFKQRERKGEQWTSTVSLRWRLQGKQCNLFLLLHVFHEVLGLGYQHFRFLHSFSERLDFVLHFLCFQLQCLVFFSSCFELVLCICQLVGVLDEICHFGP